jgi:hypothetical protein
MKRILIIPALLLLTGCNAHMASLGVSAAFHFIDPVAKLAWHGGKSAYQSASTAWQELSTEEPGEKD